MASLDGRLRERGVGAGERENLFALVGFARDSPSDIIGIVLSQLAPSEEFVAASQVSEEGRLRRLFSFPAKVFFCTYVQWNPS